MTFSLPSFLDLGPPVLPSTLLIQPILKTLLIYVSLKINLREKLESKMAWEPLQVQFGDLSLPAVRDVGSEEIWYGLLHCRELLWGLKRERQIP